MDKRNFYFDQMVEDVDLKAVQDNTEKADHNLAKDIVGAGIVSGFEVLPNTPADFTIRYTHGVAYDAYGQRIEAPGDGTKDCLPYAVSTSGNERWLTIVARFARNSYDDRLDGNGNHILYKSDEYFEIAILEGTVAPIGTAVRPTPATGDVVLTDIRLYFGQASITALDIDKTRTAGIQAPHTHINTQVFYIEGVKKYRLLVTNGSLAMEEVS